MIGRWVRVVKSYEEYERSWGFLSGEVGFFWTFFSSSLGLQLLAMSFSLCCHHSFHARYDQEWGMMGTTVRSNDGMWAWGFVSSVGGVHITEEPLITLKYGVFGLRLYIGLPYHQMNQ